MGSEKQSALDKIHDWMAKDGYGVPIGVLERLSEARAELSALRAENARMREALLRLVKAADVVYLDDEATDADDVMELETARRCARAALGGRDE